MEELFGNFVMSYLLMPVLALFLGCIMFVIAKKNQLLRNKKLIGYCILSVIILSVPALAGFLDYSFMPCFYLLSMLFYLILGLLHLRALRRFIPESQEWISGNPDKSYTYEFVFTLLLTFVAMALYSLIFNLCNELQYGLWASTSMLPFVFVSLFRRTYYSYLDIPLEIYKVWQFVEGRVLTGYNKIDESSLMVVEVELTRNPASDVSSTRISAQAVDYMVFGEWFQIFVQDYNKKFPARRIAHNDNYAPYGWIFYVKPSFFQMRRYIDPDETFAANGIKGGDLIVAKRVRQEVMNN